MRNSTLHHSGSGVAHDCIIILLYYADSCSYDYSHCVSLHNTSFDEMIFCTCYYTSAKIIQLNEWGCRDGMHHAKNRGNRVIPNINDTSTIMRNPFALGMLGGVTHDCASILDSIAKGIILFPQFFAWRIPTSPLIQLNDF